MSTKIRYSDAVAEALRMEMHRDAAIVLVGRGESFETVAPAFGANRWIEVPDADSGRIGIAAGAAASGLRPIVEVPPEALGPALVAELAQAIATAAAEGDPLGLVLRVPTHSGLGSARALAALKAIDGLAIVAPATAADAKGVLAAAVRAEGPVCILEHEALLRAVDGVPEGGHVVPIGSARVAATGTRLTVIASGTAALAAEQAAAAREEQVTVVDLRSLQPLDTGTVLDCVRGTGKVLIAEEPGFPASGDEVTALIVAEAFEHLDGPIRRLRAGRGEVTAEAIGEACDELLAY